jgi:hypothetical protein
MVRNIPVGRQWFERRRLMSKLEMDLTAEEKGNEKTNGCPWRTIYFHDGGIYYRCDLDGFDCKESYLSHFNCWED